MMLWELLVPYANNAGTPFDLPCHRAWDEKVRAVSGGLTILSPAKGQWIDNKGQVIAEKMVPVRIACDEPQIHDIARITLAHYDQAAVFYYLLSERAYIMERR